MPDNKQNNLGAIMRPKGKAEQPAYDAGLMNGGAESGRRLKEKVIKEK